MVWWYCKVVGRFLKDFFRQPNDLINTGTNFLNSIRLRFDDQRFHVRTTPHTEHPPTNVASHFFRSCLQGLKVYFEWGTQKRKRSRHSIAPKNHRRSRQSYRHGGALKHNKLVSQRFKYVSVNFSHKFICNTDPKLPVVGYTAWRKHNTWDVDSA